MLPVPSLYLGLIVFMSSGTRTNIPIQTQCAGANADISNALIVVLLNTEEMLTLAIPTIVPKVVLAWKGIKLCDGGGISTDSNHRGYCKFGCEFWNQADLSFFNQIQFPLAYNFPQDDETGVVDRSFTQDAFMGGSSATLTNQKFSLVDPETNMALSVTNCAGVHADGSWRHPNGYPEGTYFSFNATEWEKYFGSFTSNQVVSIKQCRGSETVYTGEVKVWDSDKGVHGRRNPNSAGGDWQSDDYIVMPEDDCSGLKMTLHNEALSTQQFRITEHDQLESISCPGQVLSVAVKRTSWMCINENDNKDIGLVTVDGSIKPEDSDCDAKKECNGDCTIDPTPTNDYCIDGNKLILKRSSPDDESQKWRFYQNGITNLACKREPLFEGLVISQINDDDFQDLPLFEDIDISFVNNGLAISVGKADAKKCFETKSELGEAVVACSTSDSANCIAKKAIYGSSINNWCFDYGINDMSKLFKGTAFNEPIGGWDVSRVINMEGMFEGATIFNQDLSGWKTGKVTNMKNMFYNAANFNNPINEWDVSRVENMENMFRGAKKFNQNLPDWKTEQVTNMKWMFGSASEFNGNITAWSVSNVTTMQSMFENAAKFNYDISKWRATSCSSYQAMFKNAASFNKDFSQWHATSTMNFNNMFEGATAFNQNLCAWKDHFNYQSSTDIFKGTSCNDKASPTWGVRKVKIQGGFCLLDIAEVQVYDQNNNNIAQSKTATQSSTYEQYYASNAVDGNFDTFSSTKNGVPADGNYHGGRSFEFDDNDWRCRGNEQIYDGKIKLTMINDSCCGYGRYEPESASTQGQWESNDYIVRENESCGDSWWQVDLGNIIDVSKVIIYSRKDCCQKRLSDATIQLLDINDNVVGHHKISNNVDWPSKIFNLSDFQYHRYHHWCQVAGCSAASKSNSLIDEFQEKEFHTVSKTSLRELEADKNYLQPEKQQDTQHFFSVENTFQVNEVYDHDVISYVEALPNWQPQESLHQTERASLPSLSSSNGNGAISYKVTVEEHTGGPSQLFKYRKSGTDEEGNAIFNIASVKHPNLYLSLSSCSNNADMLLLQPNENAEQHQEWIIKGGSIVNLCEKNDANEEIRIKKGSLSIDMTGASSGVTIKANIKNDEGGQKWTVKSRDVVLSQAGYEEKSEKNANQTWIPRFVDSGYELGLHPGFPGTATTCDGKQCVSSAQDRHLAKEAMRICDESMSFLLGSQISVGTLKSIADSIEDDGPERMPGYCCMDDATNSEFWGYNFDPKLNDTDKSPMECQNKGLWHLGISDEACENAGGKWFRTPCLTLKETVDERPSRFDLQNPTEGSCQDNLNRLETAVVTASMGDVDFPFTATQNGCHEFCRSLPDYSKQIGMMTQSIESEDNLSDCICIYQNDKLPTRDSMPSYSKPSPPKFTLTNSDGMALGLRPNLDCNATDDLMIETQVADPNNPYQQFQITQDGQVVSVRCPTKVLTNVLGSGGASCTDGVGLQLKEYGWIPSALTSSPTESPTTSPTPRPTTPKLANGSSCSEDSQCQSGLCLQIPNTDKIAKFCSPKGFRNGVACIDGRQCKSGSCTGRLVKRCTSMLMTSWKSLGAQPTVRDTTPDQYGQQVYDPSNTNQAKNKAAMQSSELDTFYHQIKLQPPRPRTDDHRLTKRPSSPPLSPPTARPTAKPTGPIARTTAQPTVQPTARPTARPTAQPTARTTAQPTAKPTARTTAQPTAKPTARPTAQPTARPTARPIARPTVQGIASDLQRWAFNKDGSISNAACPNLAISSSKQKDVSLNSIYFALQNPRTQLAIGISSESCEDGMTLTMQDLVYGSPNQQFIYIEADKKIVSVKCPKFAITIPNEDCDTIENLLMSSNQNVGDRNKWLFDVNKEIIQSVQCPNKFITISGALSGGARLVTVSNKFLKEETPDSTTSHSPMKAVGEPQETPGNTSFGGPPKQSDATNSPTAAYTNKYQEAKTEWDPATPPSVGSTVTLSELNAERYQKWTKQRQLFHPLMGPFSIVNPNSELAMTVDDGTCSNGLGISSSTDDHTSIRQQFYLGQHGSIFSAQCPGLVLAADNTTDNFSVALEIFQMNQKKLKWKFANGVIESVLLSHMVLANNPDDNTMILKRNITIPDSNVNWIRMNTRLLTSNSATSGWKQEWKVAFVDPEYKGLSVAEFIQDNTALNAKCYNISSAFSASFDDFAKEIVVNDASDEDQCRKVREALGFDKDHPFDVEVRENFHQHQCDPFFTGVDHTSGNDMEALSAPPKFEMVEYTPVEYEAVEYEAEEYVTIDYEEFSKGDDLGQLTETYWPNKYEPKQRLGDLT
eukprot:scaffold240115_cov36-Cyclotella_meneghiniana.AAC.2